MTALDDETAVSRLGALATRRAVSVGIIYMLPVFLVGALSPYVRSDLGLDRTTLGIAVAFFFGTGTLFMPVSGMVVDRIGPRAAFRGSALLAATGLGLIALVVQGPVGLCVALGVSGVASAIGAPAAGALVAHWVPVDAQAKAFALERSAIPFATLVAGLTVPTLAAVLPWRSVFGLVAVIALLLPLLRLPDTGSVVRHEADPGAGVTGPLRPLLAAATAFALVSTCISPLGTFLVDFAVDTGWSPARAGLLLAAGSAASIAVRLLLGWWPPRTRGMTLVAGLIAGGAVGFVALLIGSDVLVVVGVLIAYGAGWGWTGVLSHAVLGRYRATPGRATGVVQSGGALGGIIGPVLIGRIADHWGYSLAWALMGGLALLAAGLLYAEPWTRKGEW